MIFLIGTCELCIALSFQRNQLAFILHTLQLNVSPLLLCTKNYKTTTRSLAESLSLDRAYLVCLGAPIDIEVCVP